MNLHIAAGNKINTGTADIFQNNLPAVHRGSDLYLIQHTDSLPHQGTGQCAIGFNRQAGMNAASNPNRRSYNPGGIGHFRNTVLLAARTAKAGNLPALGGLLRGEVAALGAYNADEVLFQWAASSFAMTEMVTEPTAFSSRGRGSAIFSISPGAICSRGKRQSRAPASSVTVMTRSQ